MKYQMRASESDVTVHEVLVYDFIGDWIDGMFGFGVTAKSFIDELAGVPDSVKTIRVRVNSPGGDVFSAVAIANVLRDQRVSKGRKIEMFVDGLAASAASLVIMAGDTIQIADNGLIMVHDAWTVKQGNARDLRAEAEKLDKLRDASIVPTYQWHVKLSAPAILELMANETWMNADEAVALGFATEKVEGLRAAAALELSQPVLLMADPLHAEALAALLAVPPKKKEVPPAPAPAEDPAAPAPAEDPAAPAPAEGDPAAPAPAEGDPAAPAPAEAPKKEQKDLLEEAKEHVGKVHEIVDGLMSGSVVADEKSLTELLEHVTLLEDAIDQMPPIPGPIKKEEAPKEETPAPDAPAPAPAPEEKPKALELPVIQASLVQTVPAADVLRRCVENKLSLTFASSLYDAELTEEELATRINTEASRLSADSTRVTAVRAMFKKYNMENVGDLVAEAGVGVAAAGRLVTELKALKESAEIDGSLTLTGGKVHKVLSYRETYDRVNNPLKKEN